MPMNCRTRIAASANTALERLSSLSLLSHQGNGSTVASLLRLLQWTNLSSGAAGTRLRVDRCSDSREAALGGRDGLIVFRLWPKSP